MNQFSVVLDEVLEAFDYGLVELAQRNLGFALFNLFHCQLFLLLEKRVKGEREMCQCAIALDDFKEPKHNSGHHTGPAEVQFLQIAAVVGSSIKIVNHSLKRIV